MCIKLEPHVKRVRYVLTLGVCFGSLFFLAKVNAMPAVALPIVTQVIHSPAEQVISIVNKITIANQAKIWGITSVDYQHYLWLMKHTPKGKWYKQLDPAEVLGLSANSHQEMMKYAKIMAKSNHYRIPHELAFNTAYHDAYKALYPDEKAIMNKQVRDESNGLVLHAGDRVWFFTGTTTPLGGFVFQHLFSVVKQTPHVILDIYFVGNKLTKQSITSWAKVNRIPASAMNHKVTLNYGNQRFDKIKQSQSAILPLVGVLHEGHFQPVSLNSVL